MVWFVLSFISLTVSAQVPFDHSHAQWNQVLKKYLVVKGAQSSVKYADLVKNRVLLKKYTDSLQKVTKDQFQSFSLDEKQAFLINAYNAFTVELILDNWRVTSIKDIGGILAPAWKKRFFTLLGEREHLDNIEHEMLRKNFKDPRIHFALVCAAKSCPPLQAEAFVGGQLNHQLEGATQTFLKDKTRNHYDPRANTLFISSVFKWYSGDFEDKYGSIHAFIAPRIARSPEEQKILEDRKKTKLSYLNYDWSLNEASH